MEYLRNQLQHRLHKVFRSIELFERGRSIQKTTVDFLERVRAIGASASLDDYDKRKLRIFNQLNFFQLITGVIAPLMAPSGSTT